MKDEFVLGRSKYHRRGGAGSTLIAAEQSRRTFYLMELDPRYADVIVERFEQFTGTNAERVAAEATPTD